MVRQPFEYENSLVRHLQTHIKQEAHRVRQQLAEIVKRKRDEKEHSKSIDRQAREK